MNWYSSDASSSGCALNFLKLNSALCCSIRIVPAAELQGREDGEAVRKQIDLGYYFYLEKFGLVWF